MENYLDTIYVNVSKHKGIVEDDFSNLILGYEKTGRTIV